MPDLGQLETSSLLRVTMAPQAAEHALKALSRAEYKLMPDYGDVDADPRDAEAAEWVRWLMARIRGAKDGLI